MFAELLWSGAVALHEAPMRQMCCTLARHAGTDGAGGAVAPPAPKVVGRGGARKCPSGELAARGKRPFTVSY